LWSDTTGLPLASYTETDVHLKADEVFRHVFRVYPTLPSRTSGCLLRCHRPGGFRGQCTTTRGSSFFSTTGRRQSDDLHVFFVATYFGISGGVGNFERYRTA
jgi:hypothetical protein